MAREWRFGIVGIGLVGEWHVRCTPNVPGAKLVALCDIVPERAHKALEKHKLTGIPVYTDLNEMLAKEKLDVVTVATPSGNHMGPAITAMRAGKYVITEKPMEIKLDRIDKMIAEAKRNKVKIAGIFQNRWLEANRVLRATVAEGRFGRLSWAGSFTQWYRTDQYYEDGGWRGTWKLDGGGAVMNQSVHAIDLLQWIMGPVTRVSAYASSRIHDKIEVEDTLSCSLQFANGAHGSIVGTTAMYPGMPPRIEIGGENGTAVCAQGLTMFKFREERSTDKELLQRLGRKDGAGSGGGSSASDVKVDLHGLNIDSILRSWEKGEEAETNGIEARKAVAIILAMYESAKKKGAAIAVPKGKAVRKAKPQPAKSRK